MDVWAFVRETCEILVVPLYLLSFSIGPTLVDSIYDLLLALRSQVFDYSRDTICSYALKYLEPARSTNETKQKKKSSRNAC